MSMEAAERASLRPIVIGVCLGNLAYFGVEFAVARRIGSVSLFADSVDFLEDASVNFLIGIALTWSARNRASVGMARVRLGMTTSLDLSIRNALNRRYPELVAGHVYSPGQPRTLNGGVTVAF